MKKLKKAKFNLLLGVFIVFSLTAFAIHSNTKDCDDVKSYGNDAYSYFKKAYNTSTLEELQMYAKKGMRASANAEEESDGSDCNCTGSKSSAMDAYSYGKKAYNSDNLSDAQSYARKAKNSAYEIADKAEDCEGN